LAEIFFRRQQLNEKKIGDEGDEGGDRIFKAK